MKDPIGRVMEEYLSNREIAGAALIIRKKSGVIYKNKWGFSDLSGQKPVAYNSIYRMMSMTKCITAASVMKLYDDGKFVKIESEQFYDERAGQFLTDRNIKGECRRCHARGAY